MQECKIHEATWRGRKYFGTQYLTTFKVHIPQVVKLIHYKPSSGESNENLVHRCPSVLTLWAPSLKLVVSVFVDG